MKKSFTRIAVLAVALAMVLSFSVCAFAAQEAETRYVFDGKLEGPFIVTTCGQSPGSVMFNMVAKKAGVDSLNDVALSAETFEAGEAKTLVVTTGTSGKGMGAAGTDVNAEIERCVALIEKAREEGLLICCAHIEGMARRTDSSDQASIDAIMALADVVLIIEESDSDNLFTDYTTEHEIPLLKVEKALDIANVIATEEVSK